MNAVEPNTSIMADVPTRLEPDALEMLKALRLARPMEFASRIEIAMLATGGHIPEAATLLKVSERQLYRWFEQEKDLLARIPRAKRGRPQTSKGR